MSLNRQQRRKLAKQNKSIKQPAYRGLAHEERLARIMQQGISLEDLKQEYQYGFTDGFRDASPTMLKTCYASFLLALHELTDFDQDRCQEILNRADQMIVEYLDSSEIINEVWRQMGLHLDFNEPFERVQANPDPDYPWRRRSHGGQ